MAFRKRRIVLYSHDTMGLGHMRRNLLLAQTLAEMPDRPVVLLIAGANEINGFAMPAGVDCLSLPALHKEHDSQYRARRLDMSLADITRVRGHVIRSALGSFAPDVLIVDNVPLGAAGELQPGLSAIRSRGVTRCVLGLRDVLDHPERVREEWAQRGNAQAIRDHYHAVWVYGDPAICDVAREAGLDEATARKVRYAGYLDARARLSAAARRQAADLLASLELPPGRVALCTVGGGQDGIHVAAAFAAAVLPEGVNAVLIAGPMMPLDLHRQLEERTASNPRLRVLRFVAEPVALMEQADFVIGMGGYNSICEVVSMGKRALIIPRVLPRTEQLIRAERFRSLGLIEMLHPDALSPQALSDWLAEANRHPAHVLATGSVDLGALQRVPVLLEEVYRTRRAPMKAVVGVQLRGVALAEG